MEWLLTWRELEEKEANGEKEEKEANGEKEEEEANGEEEDVNGEEAGGSSSCRRRLRRKHT